MDNHIRIATIMVDLLENKFQVGNIRFGLDPLLGVIPGIGDLIAFLIAYHIVWIGVRLGLPRKKINEMNRNIVVDLLLGLIPLFGDVADVFYRANSRNLKILRFYSSQTIVEGEIVQSQ